MDRRLGVPTVALVLALSMVAVAGAQRRGWFSPEIRRPTLESFDGRFNFCRVAFNSGNMGGMFTDKSGKTFRIFGSYRPNIVGPFKYPHDPAMYAG